MFACVGLATAHCRLPRSGRTLCAMRIAERGCLDALRVCGTIGVQVAPPCWEHCGERVGACV